MEVANTKEGISSYIGTYFSSLCLAWSSYGKSYHRNAVMRRAVLWSEKAAWPLKVPQEGNKLSVSIVLTVLMIAK